MQISPKIGAHIAIGVCGGRLPQFWGKFVVMSIDNLKLRSKALIPLAVMALVVLAMVAFGAFKLSAISSNASEIIEKRDLAAVTVVRASRNALLMPYSVFGSVFYDSDSAMGKVATEGFKTAITQTDQLLDSVATLIPDKAVEVDQLKIRFDALTEKAKSNCSG